MAQDAADRSSRSSTWVVVPIRGLEVSKSRLGGQLDALLDRDAANVLDDPLAIFNRSLL